MKKKETADVRRWRLWRKNNFPQWEGLSTRVFNIIVRTDLVNKYSVRKMLGSGDWDAYKTSPLIRYSNFGWKSWMELCAWAELPEPRKPRINAVKHPCPHCKGRGWVKHWKYNPLAYR